MMLYLAGVVLDVKVGFDFIDRCHFNYGYSVLAFFWLPGLLMGGGFSITFIGDYLEKKYEYEVGICEMTALFMLFFWLETTYLSQN